MNTESTNLYNLTEKLRPPYTIENFKDDYLEKGIGVNAQDHFGFTLLHYAVARSNLEAAIFLREQGARADIPNDRGQTALDLAQMDKKPNIEQILTEGQNFQAVEAAPEATLPFQQQSQQQQQEQLRR